jgi:hypothetical protein
MFGFKSRKTLFLPPSRQAREVLKRKIRNLGVLCVLAVKIKPAKSADAFGKLSH